MKSLVLAEKPSVARDIARVLKCGKKLNGALEGEKYVVTWALGHLVTLADPEEYDKKYKEWKMEDLPMMPKKMELVVIKQTAKQYQAVKTQLFRKDVSEIIIATDAGREGELVARWILEKAHCTKPVKRLWISSVTDKAIREGFAHLRDGKDYEPLYDAAVSRAVRTGPDPYSGDDRSKGRGNPAVYPPGILWTDSFGRRNPLCMAGRKKRKPPFLFKRTDRRDKGKSWKWSAGGYRSGKIRKKDLCSRPL